MSNAVKQVNLRDRRRDTLESATQTMGRMRNAPATSSLIMAQLWLLGTYFSCHANAKTKICMNLN